jgi:hypothetical protein
MKTKYLLSLIVLCSLITPIFAQRRSLKSQPIVKSTNQIVNQTSTTANEATKLPIRRVILYSNGVAYIERRGMVSGNAEINLSFKQSQVDDVLKSMVVLDLGQGRIGAVSYNSSLPASARTAEIPFSINSKDVGGIADVLAQLQGAKVSVTSAKGIGTGSILTIEKRTIPTEANKPPITTNFLVLVNEAGEISSFDLNEVKSVKLLEEGTRKDINEFANATASARRRDAKTITVTSEGTGQREMIVSYTIAAPIWKTTYRVVLDEAGKPFFQGWAIVDNVSEENWENVQLSLISGTPISFIQPIQKPMYRYRPVVPIPTDINLQPQVYDEQGNIYNGQNEINTTKSEVSSTITNKQISNLPLATRNPIQLNTSQSAMLSNNSMQTSNYRGTSEVQTGVSDALVNNSGVETAATGEEIGDLFEYKISQPVTVLRDKSALIPIIQTKMDGERVSVYNEATRKDRPMSGLLLKNLTPLTFEGGSLTVIDRDAYAGEALMERLKSKEQRLISFALDLGTLVTTEDVEEKEPAKLVKVVNGTFQVHYFQTDKKIYKVSNQTDRKKVVYIEHPVSKGWILSDKFDKPDYTTQRYYRFRVELEPFGKKDVVVAENQPLVDSYALTNITYRDLEVFLTRRYINDETKVKLNKLIELRQQINQINVKLESFDDEEDKISDDQKRLRENIETLSKTPEAKTLITRYIDKVNQQETRLEAMQKERETLQKQREDLEKQLAVEINNFSL